MVSSVVFDHWYVHKYCCLNIFEAGWLMLVRIPGASVNPDNVSYALILYYCAPSYKWHLEAI